MMHTKIRQRVTIVATAAFFAVLGCRSSVAAPAADIFPVIVSAQPDMTTGTLTIRGANFGTSVPRVTLNSAELVILTYGPDQIGARLPVGLPPASYLLAVYRAPTYSTFDRVAQ